MSVCEGWTIGVPCHDWKRMEKMEHTKKKEVSATSPLMRVVFKTDLWVV